MERKGDNFSKLLQGLTLAAVVASGGFQWNMNATAAKQQEALSRIERTSRETDLMIQQSTQLSFAELKLRIDKLDAEINKINLEIERLKSKGYSYIQPQ